MGENDSTSELAEERTKWAESRTDWAEDRTLLANQRTFAGWMRTGLASVGIGLAFNALFGKLEPAWFPRALATLFVAVAVFIFWVAQHQAVAVQDRLNCHEVKPIKGNHIRLVAAAMALGSMALAVGIWIMDAARN